MPGTGTSEIAAGRRFRVQRTIGEGSFGSVLLAEMESIGGFKKKVAIKLLNTGWDPTSDAGRRLRDEARLLGRLQHRNIVRVDDLTQLEGCWALIMEYIPGIDLDQLIQYMGENTLSPSPLMVAEIGVAVADALDLAWSALGDDGAPLRVIHRDIKPSNIKLSPMGEVKVLDFGIARAEFEGREAKTERLRYGSTGYMAPERLLGSEDQPSGDVYALGVVLFELLTLERYGRTELAPDRQATQVEAALAKVQAKLGEAAAPLLPLLRSLLAYEPTERPSASAITEDLRTLTRSLLGRDLVSLSRDIIGRMPQVGDARNEGKVLEEGSVSSAYRPPPTSGQPLPDPSNQTLVLSSTSIQPLPPERRGLGLWIGVGLAAILAIGGAGWWLTSPRAPAPKIEAVAPKPKPAEVKPAEVPATEVKPAEVPATEVPATEVKPAEAPATEVKPAEVKPSEKTGKETKAEKTEKTEKTEKAPPVEEPPSPKEAPSDAPKIRSVKFLLTGGTGLSVSCSGVSGRGDASVLLREVPVGACSVHAGGARASVTASAPSVFTCTLRDGALSCQ